MYFGTHGVEGVEGVYHERPEELLLGSRLYLVLIHLIIITIYFIQ